LAGWLNTDVDPKGIGVYYLDAGKPFPIQDQSFDYIFNEHLIEHFTYRDGLRVLQECYRVLKPGGAIRIATPDMDKIIGLRSEEKSDLQNRLCLF
jgi:predicted SAM-dependent methyltransferase